MSVEVLVPAPLRPAKVWRVSDLKERDKEFHVTGREAASGRRFRLIYKDPKWAFGINLWCGSVWGVLPTGKRKLLKRVYN